MFPLWRLLSTFEKYGIMGVQRAQAAQGRDVQHLLDWALHVPSLNLPPAPVFCPSAITGWKGKPLEWHHSLIVLSSQHQLMLKKEKPVSSSFEGDHGLWTQLGNFATATCATRSVPCSLSENLERSLHLGLWGFLNTNPTLCYLVFNY